MNSCWEDDPSNRPTFDLLYRRFDEFMIQAEPNYREVGHDTSNTRYSSIELTTHFSSLFIF
jgi:hypothetical protein